MFDVMPLTEFEERYPDDGACFAYLERKKWPKGYTCERCGAREYYRIRMGRFVQCKGCGRQESVVSGTMFEKSKVPIRKWFWAIWFITQDKGGVSSVRLAKHIGVSQITAWRMLHKLRKVMGKVNQQIKVGGVVEFDDAYFGGKGTGKRGRGAEKKTVVLICVETHRKKAGHIIMKCVDRITKENIYTFTKHHVKDGTDVHTDAHASYAHLSKDEKHTHIVHQNLPKYASRDLQWVHMVISLAKRFLLGTFHGVSAPYLQLYLDEFSFRFNKRFSEKVTFFSLVKHCMISDPIRVSAICY